MDDAANVFDDSSFSVKSDAVKTMKTRVTNPFLESPEGGWKEEEDMELQESDDHIIVREDVSLLSHYNHNPSTTNIDKAFSQLT